MLTVEHKIFILESYFHNGTKNENGEWEYSFQTCFTEFQQRFPNVAANLTYNNF